MKWKRKQLVNIRDIHIATSYIAHLKRLALKFAQVAVEVANPEFRSFWKIVS